MFSDSQINLAKDFAAAFGVVAVVFVITIAVIFLLRRYRIAKHLATAVAIMGLSIFLALRLDDLETDKTGAYAIIYAAALGTLGWAFTLYETRSNQRRDFTLQFMRSINESSMIERHKLNVSTRYPYGVKVDEQDVDQLFRDLQDPENYNDQSAPTLYSIVQILNHYEFIANQIRKNRIDESAAKEWYCNLISAGCDKFGAVIRRFRRPQSDTFHDKYPELMWLYHRWNGKPFPDK